MPKRDFAEVVQEICESDTRYGLECYSFVREGLDHTLKHLKRAGAGPKSHVTGQELLEGMRDYALLEFGPMTKSVLNEWGIKTTDDFGQVVFNLVNSGVLGKNETDSPNDFKNVFTFDDAFVKPFAPRLNAHVRKSSTAKAKKRTSSKSKKAGSLE